MGTEEFLLEEAREEGIQTGRQAEKKQVVKNLIRQLGLSDEQAAKIAEIPVDFVRKIRAGLKLDQA